MIVGTEPLAYPSSCHPFELQSKIRHRNGSVTKAPSAIVESLARRGPNGSGRMDLFAHSGQLSVPVVARLELLARLFRSPVFGLCTLGEARRASPLSSRAFLGRVVVFDGVVGNPHSRGAGR